MTKRFPRLSFPFSRLCPVAALCLGLLGPAGGARGDVRPHAGMLRYPDVGRERIAFVYANDIWLVPRQGGLAAPLASPPGAEQFPRFSPDDQTIAFVGNYDGNRDLYSVPVVGGVPTRLTHHPEPEMLCDWTPDGGLLFYSNGLAGLRRQVQLFTIPAAGGLFARLPVPYGANGAISPDGRWLAYTPHTIDFRTWKRYRGGMQTDLWLFSLKPVGGRHESRKITDWEGTDTLPMWHGETVYYLSDAGPEHRLNIWSYHVPTRKRQQITRYADFDVKWPSIGPGPSGQGEIVFQKGPELYLLDLGTAAARAVPVIVPGALPRLRPQEVDVVRLVGGYEISPTGKRVAAEARGDIWTLPAEKGSPRNHTRTSGAAERDPAWSPDGRWIAYFSDASGEYELYIAPVDGRAGPTRLTTDGRCYRSSPTWSPDSRKITFFNKGGALFLATLEAEPSGRGLKAASVRLIDTEPWAATPRVNWSHDSRWFVYARTGENRNTALWLYDVERQALHQVTSGMFSDSWPTFDRKGDYLFYASSRNFTAPIYEDVGTTFVYASTDVLLAVPLRREVKSPFAPKSDEETPTTQPAAAASQSADSTSQPASAPASAPASQPSTQPGETPALKIDLDGFERRAVPLPVKKGRFFNLAVSHDGKLLYARALPQGQAGDPVVQLFDPADDKREEKTVFTGTQSFLVSADGKKVLLRKDDQFAIVDPAPDQKMDKPVPTDGLRASIDPRAEWRQIFTDAWRLQRDFFYDPRMHGVNWEAIRRQYAGMLDDCVCREDVGYVIAEMISELNVGHAYYRAGREVEESPSVSVGMIGADFALSEGAYRIASILEGAPWDSDARGPLSQPGVDVKAGDYLLAVNGVPVDPARDPWAAFQGLAGKVITLTVSAKPRLDESARDVVIETLASEADLRFRAWVEKNREYVARRTSGKVGYLYVPNTGIEGQNELFRQFYGQVDRQALIIDERWNGGGQIPTRFIELLNRPVTNYWARRDGHDWPWPPDSHQGPRCMLINGLAGSGGDMFPWLFRHNRLGKLIGTRTWGGLVGISGNPSLIDGAELTVPTFAFYETDGTWGVEGHGVDPDIHVVDDPALMTDGGDPQLDAAIAHILEELATHPYQPPERPAYPDRSGMGIREEDK
jgi:tricorn protease